MSNNKTLIAYFSYSGTTENAAKSLHKLVGGDLYDIKPEVPYTKKDVDYNTSNCRAEVEAKKHIRPPIIKDLKNFSEYQTIYLGFPIWWYKIPQVICSFLEAYDFTNKTIIPFATSGGSSLESVVGEINELAPKATILKGKLIHSSRDVQTLVDSVK